MPAKNRPIHRGSWRIPERCYDVKPCSQCADPTNHNHPIIIPITIPVSLGELDAIYICNPCAISVYIYIKLIPMIVIPDSACVGLNSSIFCATETGTASVQYFG